MNVPIPHRRTAPREEPSATSADSMHRVTPKALARILRQLAQSRIPTMVWGGSGTGKSDISRQVAATLGWHYHDIGLPLLDATDLAGFPWPDKERGVMRWLPPALLPPADADDEHLVNLEEIANAVPLVQTAAYQLVLDRACGEYRLPEGAAIIACGNRLTDGGGTFQMPAPLRKRFVHLEITTDLDQWMDWAARDGVAPEVQFFLRLKQDLLLDERITHPHTGAPNPRAWWRISQLLQAAQNGSGLEPDDLVPLVCGTVGEGAGTEFYAFLSMWRQLPDPLEVLARPDTAKIPKEAGVLLALGGSLAATTAKADEGAAMEARMDALVRFAVRLRPEIGEFAIGQAVRMNTRLQHTSAFQRWTTHRKW